MYNGPLVAGRAVQPGRRGQKRHLELGRSTQLSPPGAERQEGKTLSIEWDPGRRGRAQGYGATGQIRVTSKNTLSVQALWILSGQPVRRSAAPDQSKERNNQDASCSTVRVRRAHEC